MEAITNLLKSEESVKWLFTGDSITHGALHTYGMRDYVQIFEERIRYEYARGRDVVIKTGVSGWQSQTILDDIECNILQFKPQVVSIMVGMNDATQGCDYLDKFTANCNSIIDQIQSETGAVVILHTTNPIPAGGDPCREPALPFINERIRSIARQRNLILIDHYAYWTKSWEQNPLKILQWTDDPIHPNDFGHKAMAKLLFKELGIWDDTTICCSTL